MMVHSLDPDVRFLVHRPVDRCCDRGAGFLVRSVEGRVSQNTSAGSVWMTRRNAATAALMHMASVSNSTRPMRPGERRIGNSVMDSAAMYTHTLINSPGT